MTSQELVGLLGHKNDWYSAEARRMPPEPGMRPSPEGCGNWC